SDEPPQFLAVQMQLTAEPLPVAKVQSAPEPEEYPHMDEEIPPTYFDEAYTYEDSHRADVLEVPQSVASAEPEEEEG
ncbi:DNA polymerase III subunit gamma/tau, partial [Neisseria sp. P0015.S009]